MKTSFVRLIHWAVAFGLLLVVGCKTTGDMAELPLINPPILALNPAVQTFTIDATEGDSLFLSSGTSIFIPKQAFTDSLGQIVEGSVAIKYRELHNVLDIFLSGAPMHYDSLTDKGYLQTAGMFEIRASQQNKTLQLAPNKQIQVKLASYTMGDDYNFYQLNEQQKEWEYKGTALPSINPRKQEIIDSINALEPKHPFPFTKDYFVLNMSGALDIYFNNNYAVIYRYKQNETLLTKLRSFYGFDDLNVNGSVQFKKWGIYYYAAEILWKKETEKKIPKWVTQSAYMSEAKALGNDRYTFTFKDWDDNKKHTFQYTAKAIMPLSQVMRKKPDTWQAEYDAALALLSIAQKRLAIAADVFRTFNVSEMGWCNWDRFQKLNETIPVLANLKWEGKPADADIFPAYYFVNNQTSYVRFNIDGISDIKLANDPTSFIISVINSDTVAIFESSELAKFNFETLRQNPDKPVDFNMKRLPVNGRDGLSKILLGNKGANPESR